MYAKVNIKVLNHSRLMEQYSVTEHVLNFDFLKDVRRVREA